MGIHSEYLDLAVAMSTVFFLASLGVSGLQEAIQFPLRVRSKFLWAYLHDLTTAEAKKLPKGARGILSLWGKKNDVRPATSGAAIQAPAPAPAAADPTPSTKFHDWRTQQHPEIAILSRLAAALDPIAAPEITTTKGRTDQTTIQHIPPASLAQALIEVFSAGDDEHIVDAPATSERITAALNGLAATPLGRTARRQWEAAQYDVEKFRNQLEGYFDAEMVRLSGYYRRSIRLVVGVLAVLVAVFANIDTFAVAKGLWHNPQGRSALIAQADALVAAPPTTVTGSIGSGSISSGSTSSGSTSSGSTPSTPIPSTSALPSLQQLQQRCQQLAETVPPAETVEQIGKGIERANVCVDNVLTNLSGLGVIDHAIWTGPSKWWDSWTSQSGGDFLFHIVGVLVTAFALFFGSSFWFDLIKRLTGLRRGFVGQT